VNLIDGIEFILIRARHNTSLLCGRLFAGIGRTNPLEQIKCLLPVHQLLLGLGLGHFKVTVAIVLDNIRVRVALRISARRLFGLAERIVGDLGLGVLLLQRCLRVRLFGEGGVGVLFFERRFGGLLFHRRLRLEIDVFFGLEDASHFLFFLLFATVTFALLEKNREKNS